MIPPPSNPQGQSLWAMCWPGLWYEFPLVDQASNAVRKWLVTPITFKLCCSNEYMSPGRSVLQHSGFIAEKYHWGLPPTRSGTMKASLNRWRFQSSSIFLCPIIEGCYVFRNRILPSTYGEPSRRMAIVYAVWHGEGYFCPLPEQ